MDYKAWDVNAYERHKQLLEQEDKTFWKVLLPEILKLIRSHENYSTFSVLDVGAGSGILSSLLSQEVRKVVGVDPSGISISIADNYIKEHLDSRIHNVEFKHSSIEAFNYSEPFDLAISHMALHAIEHIRVALTKIYTLLKPDGRFIFSIPHPKFYALVKPDIFPLDYEYGTESSFAIPFQISNSDPLKEKVPYFHRPIEKYSQYLFEAGFTIEEMHEPHPNQNHYEEGHFRRKWEYPGFLIFLCQKISN